MSQADASVSNVVFRCLHRALAGGERTREPLNALVVWTELGRGLAGTLEQVGGDQGLLRKLIAGWCQEQGAREDVNLADWMYRLEGPERLGKEEAAAALRKIQAELEEALPALAAEAQASDEARRALYLAVVRGWFPVGLDLVRSMPRGRTAERAEQLGALSAWCQRYLPVEGGDPAGLGVRVER